MDEKLARGHATDYINGPQDYGRLLNWTDGPGGTMAIDAFERSSFSKKPGRVLERLTPHLRPQFHWWKIDHWARQSKVVSATGLASTAENRVYCLPNDTGPLYSECAVFLVRFRMSLHYGDIGARLMMGSSISRHVIARLLERGGVNPTSLTDDIFVILEYCTIFAAKTVDTAIDHSVMTSFMLPFESGALVAGFMDMNPAQLQEGHELGRVLSVRTWLDSGKLSDLDMERMGGLDELKDVMKRDYGAADERFLRWIEGNARPWQFSDSTLGDQG